MDSQSRMVSTMEKSSNSISSLLSKLKKTKDEDQKQIAESSQTKIHHLNRSRT